MKNGIPKRIFQMDKSEHLPPLLHATTTSVKVHNQDFEYVFLDDPAVEDFIDTNFKGYRSILDSVPFRIQKYDLVRYLIIYEYGGFYFDTDMLLNAPLRDLCESACVFPFERLSWSSYLRNNYGMDWEVGNYAFGATARHPFLAAVIENCLRGFRDKQWAEQMTQGLPRLLRNELYVIYTTGPGLVTRTLAEFANAHEHIRILFPDDVLDKANGWNRFGKYGVHLGVGSWRASHNSLRRRWLNTISRKNELRAISRGQALGTSRSLNR